MQNEIIKKEDVRCIYVLKKETW